MSSTTRWVFAFIGMTLGVIAFFAASGGLALVAVGMVLASLPGFRLGLDSQQDADSDGDSRDMSDDYRYSWSNRHLSSNIYNSSSRDN